MRDNFSTENINVGDKVIVYFYGLVNRRCIGEVVKKTPTGLVDVKYGETTCRFNSRGAEYSRGGMYSRTIKELRYYNEEVAQKILQDRKRESILSFLKNREWDIYTDDELERLYKFVAEFRES